jgi:hypothetical protein
MIPRRIFLLVVVVEKRCAAGFSAPGGRFMPAVRGVFAVYSSKRICIRLVVIVNDDAVVDKKRFLHKISGLRARELAGQELYRACMDVGEKTACLQ